MPKYLRLLASFILIFPCGLSVAASSKGTDFWFAYPKGATISSGSASVAFTVTGDIGTTLSITYPSGSGSTTTTGLLQAPPAGSSYSGYYRLTFSLSPTDVYQATQTDSVDSRVFHVVASAPVSIEQDYTVSTTSLVSPPDARWQAIPTDALGKEYYVLSYRNQAQPYTSSPDPTKIVRNSEGTQFVVVATTNGTDVTIDPSISFGSRVAHTPFTISLNQGQEYRAFSSDLSADFSGTSISATKPISVIAGHTCAEIPARLSSTTTTNNCSTIMETLFPVVGWSKQFIMPTFSAVPNEFSLDQVRFVSSQNGTQVTVNDKGVLHTFNLAKGEWGQYVPYVGSSTSSATPTPLVINSNYPIMVAQYMAEDISYLTEPAMTILPGYDNYLTSYLFNFPQNTVHDDFIHVIVQTADAGSLRLDGSSFSTIDFSPVPGTNYSWAYKRIINLNTGSTVNDRGNHTLTGTSAFGLVAYSRGTISSYVPLGTATSPGFNLLSGSISTGLNIYISSSLNQYLLGDKACVTVSALDSANNPKSNLTLTLTVSGANKSKQTFSTDSNGSALVCYVGASLGSDMLLVSDSSGVQSNQLSLTWLNPTAKITFSIQSAEILVGRKLCLSATGLDSNNLPVSNVPMSFDIGGANLLSGSSQTNASGVSEYCYVPQNPGVDKISAISGNVVSTVPVTVTIQNNPACDVVSSAMKTSFSKEVLGTCLSALSKSGDLSRYSLCESTAKSKFVSALQSANVASGCLASGKTVTKADQLLALIKPVENPVLNEFNSAIQTFGKARAKRRFSSITSQIYKIIRPCLDRGTKINEPKAINLFNSLFVLSGKPLISTDPSTFVGEFNKSCSAISEF